MTARALSARVAFQTSVFIAFGSLHDLFVVIKRMCESFLVGCCRNFRRAAAAGEKLDVGLVHRLLMVFSAGDSVPC